MSLRAQLETLRDLRAKREEAARATLNAARGTAERARFLQGQARARLAEFDRQAARRKQRYFDFASEYGVSGASLTSARAFHDDLANQRPSHEKLLAQATRAARIAEEEAERKRADWAAAHRAVEAMEEALSELRCAEVKARLRREERTASELATLKWRRTG